MLTAHSRDRRYVRNRSVLASLALATIITGTASTGAQVSDQEASGDHDRLVFVVDVAEDLTQFNPTFVKPTDTQPERGSFFVTEGNVFRGGTIAGDGAAFDPNTEGAIGRWLCRGTHLVSASDIPAAPLWVSTAQLYLFSPNPASLVQSPSSLATEGVEGSGTLVRVVAGGTGAYRDYVGEQRQEFLGFNATGGVNLRVTFTLKRAVRR